MITADMWHEGVRPAIPPNAGHRRTVSWTLPDWLAFERDIRTSFPNAFFYENWPFKTDPAVKPTFRILGRLDERDIEREINVMFPYPGWEPELELIEPERPGRLHHWAWKNYLSPIISFYVRTHNEPAEYAFSDVEPDKIVLVWGTRDILTSYRRELSTEHRIVNKILRMIDKRSGWAVPVSYGSYGDFRAGRGKIWPNSLRSERCRASPAVIEWAMAGPPDRLIYHNQITDDQVEVWLPLDRVPEELLVGVYRPKWAQRK